MDALSAALAWLTSTAFAALALWTIRDWLRNRERGRRLIAGVVTSLAVAAILYPINNAIVGVLATASFLAAGYALLRLRDFLLPLGRPARIAAIASIPFGLTAATYLTLADPSTMPVAYVAAAVTYLGVWLTCAGEPVVRFWRVARRRPAVQRARLRALSAGYTGAIAVLIVNFLELAIVLPRSADLGLEIAGLAIVPILFASLTPPAWLRRLWGAREQAAATRATQALLNANSETEQLSAAGLEWSARLVGADEGFLLDPHGDVLATWGVRIDAARALAGGEIAATAGAASAALDGKRTVLRIPLSDEGTLVLLAGPFTPVFGTDELSRLNQYAIGLTVALQRERLAYEVRRKADEVARLNRDLEVRVFERTRALHREDPLSDRGCGDHGNRRRHGAVRQQRQPPHVWHRRRGDPRRGATGRPCRRRLRGVLAGTDGCLGGRGDRCRRG
jgi:hypothetical protein